MSDPRRPLVLASLLTLAAAPQALQDAPGGGTSEAPVRDLLNTLGEDVQTFNDHVVYLASPFMDGRLPGTRGMEIAKDYVQYHFEQYGLEPAFDNTDKPNADGSGRSGYRDPFDLGGTIEVLSESFSGPGGAYAAGRDYAAMTNGEGGSATGELVFVGYSVERGPGGDYRTFGDDDDLTGKVAFMYRFEPMDAEGRSQWARTGPWGTRAGFARKLRAVAERNPAAVIICNTPGADDPRVGSLDDARSATRSSIDVPVVMMSVDAGTRLLEAAGQDAMALRRRADEAGGIEGLGVEVTVEAELKNVPLVAENVGGLLRGRGDLENELIVVGAHLDHLGMGYFGSRTGPGELHPGADDNASGSAAVMMIADKLSAWYAEQPESADLRSILFLCFSAEESGLNGAFHYAADPIRSLDDHALMINFDMIGRVTGGRLTVAGTDSAVGMRDWLQPILDASPFVVMENRGMSGGSDHAAFYQKEIPILFSINDLHDDYHTPRDSIEKINRVGGAQVVAMYTEIVQAAASWDQAFVFQSGRGTPTPAASGPAPGEVSVRFGIAPAGYDPDEKGVPVARVTEGTSADEAGVQAGDRLMTWDGAEIGNVVEWMSLLADCEPGQVVAVGVDRDGERVDLQVTLQAK